MFISRNHSANNGRNACGKVRVLDGMAAVAKRYNHCICGSYGAVYHHQSGKANKEVAIGIKKIKINNKE